MKMHGMPVMTWTGFVALTSEPERSCISPFSVTSSATSPAFIASVTVPFGPVAITFAPETTLPFAPSATLTDVPFSPAVIAMYEPMMFGSPNGAPVLQP
jgi:hypothetical protein